MNAQTWVVFNGLDMSVLYKSSFFESTAVSFLFAAGPALKAVISGMMIVVFIRTNLESPFTMEISNRLRMVSFVLIGSWIVAVATQLVVRFNSLESLCEALECRPRDSLEFRKPEL